MLKTIAIIFGLVIFIVGVLGYFPEITPDGMLLGIFHVNNLHNIIHLVTGVIAFFCGLNSTDASRVFFKVFGLIYTLVALLGFYYMNNPIFGLIANNLADAILHLVIGVVALILGFGCCSHYCSIDKK